jgi:HK97 family phage major capsid protein/HK97 family phage prohead protease
MPKELPTYLKREAHHGQRITSGIPEPGSQLDRRATVVTIDKEKRTLELSFSSEIEVKRWAGFIEVLDHSPDAADLLRLNARGPLLFNHDLDEVIGVIESAEIASDRKGRALVRFGNSARAKEVWDDVQDGILSNVSVGYRIHEIKLKESRENGDDVYVVTRWEPYEISIVSAPADTSVGVGRSAQPTKPEPKKDSLMNRDQMIAWLAARGIQVAADIADTELVRMVTEYKPATPTPAPAQRSIQVGEDNSDAVKTERKRMAEIMAAGKQFKLGELAERFVTEGKSLDEFRAAALDEISKRTASFRESQSPIGLSDRETRSFQFLRLVRALCDPTNKKLRDAAGFELEAVEAAAAIHKKATQRDAKGIIIPNDILRSRLIQGERDIVSIKDGAGYTGTGSNTVQTQLLASSYFELLREASTIMRLGTTLGGLVGNLDIPKEAADGDNAGWIGEDDEAPVSEITFGKISLTPKTVATTGSVTREMLMQSSLDVEAIFRRSLARAVARKIDYAGYYGDGTSNAPVGIRETDGVNYKPFTGDNPTFPELVDMETLIATENLDPRSARYVFNAAMRGYLKQTKKFSTDATSMIMLENGEVNGYGHEMTNRIATGQVFFGDFAELLIGMWGGLDIVVDPYTHSNRGRIRMSLFQTVDFEVRRPEAFTFGARSTLS